jgi:hypothetical protein
MNISIDHRAGITSTRNLDKEINYVWFQNVILPLRVCCLSFDAWPHRHKTLVCAQENSQLKYLSLGIEELRKFTALRTLSDLIIFSGQEYSQLPHFQTRISELRIPIRILKRLISQSLFLANIYFHATAMERIAKWILFPLSEIILNKHKIIIQRIKQKTKSIKTRLKILYEIKCIIIFYLFHSYCPRNLVYRYRNKRNYSSGYTVLR